MAIDLEQFHQVFFEESFEGLDIMESSLMELDPDDIDSETINAIFRCAHSIKGGSATFGFTSIAEFTHILETLLDQVRSGTRGVKPDDINLYLKSVDCMREMLALLQDGETGETELSVDLHKTFSALLNDDQGDSGQDPLSNNAEQKDVNQDTGQNKGAETVWRISFVPHENIFHFGSDPLKNIQLLSELGKCKVECDLSQLPDFASYTPESAYLRWSIELVSDCKIEQIKEVFEWIEDECDLNIEQSITSKIDESRLNENNVGSTRDWMINFHPGIDILKTGNDPTKLFIALRELGELVVEIDAAHIPDLISLDAENCYLSWNIRLLGSKASHDDILSVFEWVADESEISVSPLDDIADQPEQISESTPLSAEKVLDQETEAGAQEPESQQISQKKAPSPKKVATKSSGTDTSSIRVGIDKVDSLINMVGELVITQSMLGQLSNQLELERVPSLVEGLNQLEQNTRELQESVMKIRMLPISFAFSRFPRMVRDLGQTLGKSVELEMNGENTELDKTVMEKIGDPLVHLVRNAVDHGLETPDERTSKGKGPTGKVTLNAFHQSGNVVIEIIDDGKGLDRNTILKKALEKKLVSERDAEQFSDEQVFDLIFQPGFSTAQTVSDVSGRGVGMDVVKRNIQALNGVVEISSKLNEGSKITIKLPLTLAILDGQLVRIGSSTYIFPLTSIIESMQCSSDLVNSVAGGCSVFKLRDEYVPIIELHKAFSIEPDSKSIDDSLLVVVESEGDKVGIVVDDLLAQQQVVIKSLEHNYKKVEGISGATILGDGTVALIIDITGVIKLSEELAGAKAGSLGNVISDFDRQRLSRDTSIVTTH